MSGTPRLSESLEGLRQAAENPPAVADFSIPPDWRERLFGPPPTPEERQRRNAETAAWLLAEAESAERPCCPVRGHEFDGADLTRSAACPRGHESRPQDRIGPEDDYAWVP